MLKYRCMYPLLLITIQLVALRGAAVTIESARKTTAKAGLEDGGPAAGRNTGAGLNIVAGSPAMVKTSRKHKRGGCFSSTGRHVDSIPHSYTSSPAVFDEEHFATTSGEAEVLRDDDFWTAARRNYQTQIDQMENNPKSWLEGCTSTTGQSTTAIDTELTHDLGPRDSIESTLLELIKEYNKEVDTYGLWKAEVDVKLFTAARQALQDGVPPQIEHKMAAMNFIKLVARMSRWDTSSAQLGHGTKGRHVREGLQRKWENADNHSVLTWIRGQLEAATEQECGTLLTVWERMYKDWGVTI